MSLESEAPVIIGQRADATASFWGNLGLEPGVSAMLGQPSTH